jgi:hypothetical protein
VSWGDLLTALALLGALAAALLVLLGLVGAALCGWGFLRGLRDGRRTPRRPPEPERELGVTYYSRFNSTRCPACQKPSLLYPIGGGDDTTDYRCIARGHGFRAFDSEGIREALIVRAPSLDRPSPGEPAAAPPGSGGSRHPTTPDALVIDGSSRPSSGAEDEEVA